MKRESIPTPTAVNPARPVDAELTRWSGIYAGEEYFYGEEPGPIARRTVRYHRPWLPRGGSALDAGCGEGQDLVFLVERGYDATGVEFTPEGAEKAKRLLAERGLSASVVHADLREFLSASPVGASPRQFDLVLVVNSLQFLGADAPACLERLMDRVAPGGVLGLSLFGSETGAEYVAGTVWFTPLETLLARFQEWQCLEAAKLWQWNVRTNEPQPFVTLIARKAPPAGMLAHLG